MHRRSLVVIGMVLALALPLSASQFIPLPFDEVASESKYIVRGTIDQTWSAWDSSHEVIFTYATMRVNRYFGESTGPDTLVIREVGGTVDGYTQEAIGFPMIRKGEDVVLMLSQWEDSADLRIHAFNQGKYLVRGAKTTTLEGTWDPKRFVILEFPTADAARGWWNSPEYAPAKALRQSCATTQMLLVEGPEFDPSKP